MYPILLERYKQNGVENTDEILKEIFIYKN